MEMKRYAVLIMLAFCVSCGTQRHLEELRGENLRASIALPEEKAEAPQWQEQFSAGFREDTVPDPDFQGRRTLVMNAVRDEATGEMVAADVVAPSYVTARFRNVAERNGGVDIEFQVVVPAKMQESRWQMRLCPRMHILADTLHLSPVVVTGEAYRRAQLRGYERYQRFIDSIVQDSLEFVSLGQLEMFIKRNIPELYSLKYEKGVVTDERFESIYGVDEQEAVAHYMFRLALRYNKWKIRNSDRFFRKYVKAPITSEGLRLDTVVLAGDEFIYNYIQRVATRPELRRIDVVLGGEILKEGERIYEIPDTEPLTFYVSSLSAFADGTERFLTEVVERRVEVSATSSISFETGKSEVREDLADNRSQIGIVRGLFESLSKSGDLVTDSVTVTSSASPDGSLQLNRRLSKQRAESVGRYFRDGFRESGVPVIARNIPENWNMLDSLVAADGTLTAFQKERYFSKKAISDPDARETALRKEESFHYLRDTLYPMLRLVRFDFHLHRRDMVKDTIHTTVPDTVYRSGVRAIRDRDYARAAVILAPYQDFNSAVAYTALGRNSSALAILERLERSAEVNYMLAIIYSRLDRSAEAAQCYERACRQNRSFVHRGNLDPEISALARTLRRGGEDL